MCQLRRARLVIRTTKKLLIRRLRRSRKSLSRTRKPALARIAIHRTWERRNRQRVMMRRRSESASYRTASGSERDQDSMFTSLSKSFRRRFERSLSLNLRPDPASGSERDKDSMFTSLSKSFRRRFERSLSLNLRPDPARYRSRFCNLCRHLRRLVEQSTPTGITFCAGLLFLLLLLLFPFSVLPQSNDSDYSKF